MKRGLLYSVLTIIILIPVLTLLTLHPETLRGYGKSMGTNVRLKSGLYFLDSVNEDFERAVKIVGRRSLLACVNYVINNGVGIDSAEERIVELFENGTINGTHSEIMDCTIYDWVNSSDEIAIKRGFVLQRKIENVSVSMGGPWHVTFHVNYSITLEDVRGVFSYERNVSKHIPVSILGLEDPLYILRTNGKVSRKIEMFEGNLTEKILSGSGGNNWSSGISVVTSNPDSVAGKAEKVLIIGSATQQFGEFAGVVTGSNSTPISPSYVISGEWNSVPNNTRIVVEGNEGEVWSIENLYNLYGEKLYISGDGPSFLDRLENKLVNTYPNAGIESLVNKDEMIAKLGSYEDRSNVDYIYFNSTLLNIYKVKGMPEKFRIDEEHLERYGVNNTLSYT
ncbi:MAG TPA: hypothetical protein ENF95_00750 [Candidatus Aenigmarchaeota archaeon]|nr:hypothetical protein [Candidatus Aenigmarchaeota archaeon]